MRRAVFGAGFLALSLVFFSCSFKPSGESSGIISLTPALTSLLIDLGLKDQIKAVTRNDFFLEKESKESVGSLIQFSLEKILALKPKTVVYQDFQRPWLEAILKTPGIQFIEVSLLGLDSILSESRRLAQALHLPPHKVDQLIRQVLPQKRPDSVFLYVALVDREENFGRSFAAGKKSYLSDLLALLGGKNALPGEKDYLPVSEEYLLSLSHSVVILDFSLQSHIPPRFVDRPLISVPYREITIPDLRLKEKLAVIEKALNQSKAQPFRKK